MHAFPMSARAGRHPGSAGRPIALTLTALLLFATACSDDSPTPSGPMSELSPSFGKGGGGNGGGGGGNGGGGGSGGQAAAKIVFTNGPDGSRRIMTMNPDGSGLTAITAQSEFETPIWSPDYKKIMYTEGDGGSPPIYTMSANGSRVVHVGTGREPRWSPNGSRIAFQRFASINGGPEQSDVFVMNSDGSNVIQLTVMPEYDGSPSWSPDGNRIAFSSGRTGSDEIWVMNVDGTGQARVTYCGMLAAQCRNPRWSPVAGDERILYDFVGITTSLRTITPAGVSGPTMLPGLEVKSAGWSPDATKLVFSHVAPGLIKHNIYTANLDGTGLTRLTFNVEQPDYFPAWTR